MKCDTEAGLTVSLVLLCSHVDEAPTLRPVYRQRSSPPKELHLRPNQGCQTHSGSRATVHAV